MILSDRRTPRWQHSALALVALVAFAHLQGSGLARLGNARVTPDLVLCGVLAWAYLYGPGAGATYGFLGGLALDGISVGPVGMYCLILAIIGAILGASRLGEYSEDLIWVLLAGAAGSLAFYAAGIAAARVFTLPFPVVAALPHVLFPALVLNTLITMLFVTLLRRRSRRRYGRYQV